MLGETESETEAKTVRDGGLVDHSLQYMWVRVP